MDVVIVCGLFVIACFFKGEADANLNDRNRRSW